MTISMGASAQYEHTTWQQRMGHGRDSVENMVDQLVWTPYLNANSNVAATASDDMEVKRTWDAKSYRAWYDLTHGSAAFSQFSLYASGGGADMLRYLLCNEKDEAVKLIYFNDLMWLSDFRIKNLDALNSLPDFGPATKSSLGDVQTWKAHYYYTEGKHISPRVYSREKAYQYYADAMKTVREQKSVQGTEVRGFLLLEYFRACKELYLSNPDKYLEQFLQDYLDCTETCNRMVKLGYEEKDTTKSYPIFSEYYHYAYLNIVNEFNATGAGSVASLQAFYEPRLEANKQNAEFLEQGVRFMLENGCTDDTFFRYCKASYQLKPTYRNSIGQAMASQRDGLRDDMRDYYLKAAELASNDEQRGVIYYRIASSLASSRKPSSKLADGSANSLYKEEYDEWEKDMSAAISNYDKMLLYRSALLSSSSLDVQRLVANAYWDLSYIYYRLTMESQARENLNRAMAQDPVLYSASNNPNVATRLQNINALRDAINRQQAASKQHSNVNSAQMKAYKEWLEKKKAEDAFWNAGRARR